MDDHKFLKFDINTVLSVIALAFGAYQFFLYQQIEAFKNTVEQNKNTITQVIEDIKNINTKLGSIGTTYQNEQGNLSILVQEHEQKIQLLHDTLNKLYSNR